MSEDKPTDEARTSSDAAAEARLEPGRERVDEDGLPIDRPATLDDVRGDAGSGRIIAIGCSLVVAIVLGLFWLIRGGLLR